MANIILPAVPILSEIDDSTKLLIEQAGEINRYPISDLDIGGGDVTIDLSSSDSVDNNGNPINADTLGGVKADEYVKKSDAMVVTKNYSVVGGPNQPENPTENMIWVQTETEEIGKVYFSGVKPSNCADNDIWISTSSNSSTVAFDSIKIGNDTMNTVYPISAKQYVNGAWVDKDVKSYQGGAWVDWWDGNTLYCDGNEFSPQTGGWGTRKTAKGTITKNATNITIELTGTPSASTTGFVYTQDKIDISKKSRIIVNSNWVASKSGDVAPFISIVNSITDRPDTSAVAVSENTNTLDVSGISSGSYHICIGSMVWGGGSGKVTLNITEVRAE